MATERWFLVLLLIVNQIAFILSNIIDLNQVFCDFLVTLSLSVMFYVFIKSFQDYI